MSRPTRQQLAHMTREEKIIDFNSRMQEKLDEVQQAINASREMLHDLQTEVEEVTDFIINDELVKNVLIINLIKFYRASYGYELCCLRFYTNIISNTLTQAHFDATHERMTELLEIQFETFGMKHQGKWSKDAINNFENYKNLYEIYKGLHNLN